MGRRRTYADDTERQRACRQLKVLAQLSQIQQVHAEGYSLYQGDAQQVVPLLTGLDVLITDPPYGVNLGGTKGTGGGHGLRRAGYASYVDTYENFCRTVVPILTRSLDKVARGAVFTGPHEHEQRKPTIRGGVYCPAGSGCNVWGFTVFHRVLFYGAAPTLPKGARFSTVLRSVRTLAEPNGHPCPKPLPWMQWLVALGSVPGELVLDPFMGSGTTGVACVELGRRFVGIELDPGYFALAAGRLAQATRQGVLFPADAPAAQQLAL